ncbi:baeRF12 domain-containing protein [Qipengyuania sp. YIM B01966]|uniref:baeRF12 domain-containing protein n=1 Tax=Qipengyuania sp. YIM B01966 TaxID=2778646 RepID=UPI0018F57A5C
MRTGQVRLLLMKSNLAPNARLDDYVRAGIGDPADALRDLSQFRNVKGDEFAGLVLWMRAWNLAHPDDMVRIAGFDAQDSGRDADIALTYLAARDAAVAGLSIFEHGLDPPEGMNRAEYYGRRDRAMARIALRMQQRTGKGAVIWAHDLHVIDRLDPPFAAMSGYRSLGMELEDALGAGYRSIGFSFTDAIVRTTPARTGQQLAQVRVNDQLVPLPNSGPDTVGALFAAALPGRQAAWIDMDRLRAEPALAGFRTAWKFWPAEGWLVFADNWQKDFAAPPSSGHPGSTWLSGTGRRRRSAAGPTCHVSPTCPPTIERAPWRAVRVEPTGVQPTGAFMKLPANAHVAVVDGTQFRFFRNVGEANAIKLQGIEAKDIETNNKSAGVRDHEATDRLDGGRQMEELSHAAGVADKLNHLAVTNKLDKVVIIADPSSLGEMRRHYHTELQAALVGEIDKTLTNSPVEDIIRAIENA